MSWETIIDLQAELKEQAWALSSALALERARHDTTKIHLTRCDKAHTGVIEECPLCKIAKLERDLAAAIGARDHNRTCVDRLAAEREDLRSACHLAMNDMIDARVMKDGDIYELNQRLIERQKTLMEVGVKLADANRKLAIARGALESLRESSEVMRFDDGDIDQATFCWNAIKKIITVAIMLALTVGLSSCAALDTVEEWREGFYPLHMP